MAKVQLKVDTRALQKKEALVNRTLKRAYKSSLPVHILDSIATGVSPVSGQGRFKGYSKSYKKAIKAGYVEGKNRVRPVNLKATGKMLNSMKIRITKKGLSLWFSDSKAGYHNDGTDKMPKRQMLPSDGKDFSANIKERLRETTRKVLKQILG